MKSEDMMEYCVVPGGVNLCCEYLTSYSEVVGHIRPDPAGYWQKFQLQVFQLDSLAVASRGKI